MQPFFDLGCWRCFGSDVRKIELYHGEEIDLGLILGELNLVLGKSRLKIWKKKIISIN